MKVLFLSANTERLVEPVLPLGAALVAAAARRAGHQVFFLDLMTRADPWRDTVETLETFRPDVIGLSVRNIDDQEMRSARFLLEPVRDLVSLLRRYSRAPIVLGGAGYSIYPESALAYLGADFGIQGEGEAAFPLLLTRLETGLVLDGTPGLFRAAGQESSGPRSYETNLDLFSLDRDLDGLAAALDEEQIWFPYQTRRGCPMDCSYCSTASIEGRRLRKRTPELAVREIRGLAEKGIRRFQFVDNTFNIPEPYALRLCRELAPLGEEISWRCIFYPWRVSEDLVKAMAKAGCKEVTLGFESGSEPILRAMNKRYRPADVRETSRLFEDHGIHRLGMILLGGPGETLASVEQTLVFADSLDCELVAVTAGIRIYPSTRLADVARAEGVIRPDDDLLHPRFYLARGLEVRLPELLEAWTRDRPNWLM